MRPRLEKIGDDKSGGRPIDEAPRGGTKVQGTRCYDRPSFVFIMMVWG